MTQISTDAKERLEQQFVPHYLTPELLDELIDQSMVVNYGASSTIFLQGAPADMLFWLVRGMAKVYCPLDDGTRVLAQLAGPGDLIGQADFLNGNGRRRQLFEVRAATRCEVALLTHEHTARVVQKLDKLEVVRFLQALNTTWAQAAFWYVTLLGLSFHHRLETVLAYLASRFGIKDLRGIMITPELSQLDLAEMIGSSRPMVSRLIKEMTEKGELIRADKRCIIAADAPWLQKASLLNQLVHNEGFMRGAANGHQRQEASPGSRQAVATFGGARARASG